MYLTLILTLDSLSMNELITIFLFLCLYPCFSMGIKEFIADLVTLVCLPIKGVRILSDYFSKKRNG